METILIVSSVFLWLMLLCNLFLTLALIRRVNEPSTRPPTKTEVGPEIGQPAPDFTAEATTGEIVHLSKYLGSKVVFFFISTACTPCRKVIPDVLDLAPKAALAGIEFVIVSDGEAQDTRSFVEEFDIHIPVLIAPRQSSSFLNDYNAIGVPSYCVINELGTVLAAGYPANREWKKLVESWAYHEEKTSNESYRSINF